MNIVLIKHIFVGFMVSEIPRVSIFWHCPVTFPYYVVNVLIIILTIDIIINN